ncbi:MAG: prepilin-type N-terminal cleavage/methylation domain-containing protein [Candidatus Omnitrophica bacterium]|nr:prepilin-type N-terminal cleavage/methylation domain-containing protein [Candidatus Omnitrophota bacterium]MBU1047425.1 prepilin-type N-terminal cleavage/methylation domain-containing protein [Candidatus Omnitrophota bacterium]MBU1630830.1 prepilin-type N-terminal cleavage/methylation domain-containing protein [Candidatus Omnitrophota bacterium]MBU1767023.1 prepilin-type N-terminal cleavage/methylation domain-containing protein [Candidatus Omnitrophota bacterium]MBU1888789.1 prepilin-type N-
MNKTKAGFTLLEVLTVVAIIGLLAAMIFPNLGKVRIRARKSKAILELKTIQLALMDYYVEYSGFPTNLDTLPHDNPAISNGLQKLQVREYLDIVPSDGFDFRQIYRYYSCVDDKDSGNSPPADNDGTPDPMGPFVGLDLADSCIVYSVGVDGKNENKDSSDTEIRNFNKAHTDAYRSDDDPIKSDNIYLLIDPRGREGEIRYKE